MVLALYYYRIKLTKTVYGATCDCKHVDAAAKQAQRDRHRSRQYWMVTDPGDPTDSIIATKYSDIRKSRFATKIVKADAITLKKQWEGKAPDGSKETIKKYNQRMKDLMELDIKGENL